jgi:hypothetical protein
MRTALALVALSLTAGPVVALPMFGGDGVTNAELAKAQQTARQKQAKAAHDAQAKCQQQALAAVTAAQKAVARQSCLESAAKNQATTHPWVAPQL